MSIEWKAIPSFPKYEASTTGEIRNAKTKCVIKPFTDLQQEYGRITVYGEGKRRKVMAHTLVAQAFLGDKPYGHEIDHINSDRTDNRPCNLRYVTPEQNRANPMSIIKQRIGRMKVMIPASF